MSTISFSRLRRFNLILAALHAAQGVLVLVLSRQFALPINTTYLDFNQQTRMLEPATHTLFDIQLPWLVAVFFFLSAAAHLVVGTVYFKKYQANLRKGINKARWYEYSLSASVMMVAIALLVGIYDAGTLLGIFALVAVMNLLGLVMEVHNQTTKRTSWLSYNIGVLAGILPWLVIGLSFWAAEYYGSGNIPTFVYWIYVSIFIFFNCFALNMVLQYKRLGKWRDYLYGERTYMILSLVAKSLLAWQIFAGTLRP